MDQRYVVNWEDGEVVSVVVNGVEYDSPEHVPDPEDRATIRRLIDEDAETDLDVIEEPQGDPFVRVVTNMLLLIGGLLVVLALIAAMATYRELAREVKADGHVVSLTVRNTPTGEEFFYPVVEFTTADGVTKTVQLGEGSWPPAYEAGEAVTVLYDSEKPLYARIDSATSTLHAWTWALILGVLGVAFLVITSFVRWVFAMGEASAPLD